MAFPLVLRSLVRVAGVAVVGVVGNLWVKKAGDGADPWESHSGSQPARPI